MKGLSVALALTSIVLTGALVYVVTRPEEAEPPPTPPPPTPPEEIIDAEYKSGYVYWAALTDWQRVNTRWPNEWPADTDISFAWEIKNTGDVGAYFQVYIFEPGSWQYLSPGDQITVFEDVHTAPVPVIPGYQFCRINILGRKLDGERIGAVWTSEEFEVSYV